jgi:hypothetical protein
MSARRKPTKPNKALTPTVRGLHQTACDTPPHSSQIWPRILNLIPEIMDDNLPPTTSPQLLTSSSTRRMIQQMETPAMSRSTSPRPPKMLSPVPQLIRPCALTVIHLVVGRHTQARHHIPVKPHPPHRLCIQQHAHGFRQTVNDPQPALTESAAGMVGEWLFRCSRCTKFFCFHNGRLSGEPKDSREGLLHVIVRWGVGA